jgi:hypothetical protein
VVWAIFEGNDLIGADLFTQWQENPTARQTPLQRFASRSLIAQILPRTPVSPRWRREFAVTDGSRATIDPDYTYFPDAPARWPRGWRATASAIREGTQLARSNGLDFLVLFVPVKARVLGKYIQWTDERDRDNWLPGGVMDAAGDFGSAVAEECRQAGCDFLDLTPSLRRAAERDNRRIYFTVLDPHLDADGNDVVADEVSAWLRTKGLGPRASTE